MTRIPAWKEAEGSKAYRRKIRDKDLNLSESMKGYSLYLALWGAVMALGIFTSCTAQTTHSTRVSEVKDRHNFRDEQEGAPRADNASIER